MLWDHLLRTDALNRATHFLSLIIVISILWFWRALPNTPHIEISLSNLASIASSTRSHLYAMASASKIFFSAGSSFLSSTAPRPGSPAKPFLSLPRPSISRNARRISCEATETSKLPASSPSSGDSRNWVPVVPLAALPRGERRVIIQGNETILLLWFKDEVIAIENRSPAEGAYSEGLINAKLTQVPILLESDRTITWLFCLGFSCSRIGV